MGKWDNGKIWPEKSGNFHICAFFHKTFKIIMRLQLWNSPIWNNELQSPCSSYEAFTGYFHWKQLLHNYIGRGERRREREQKGKGDWGRMRGRGRQDSIPSPCSSYVASTGYFHWKQLLLAIKLRRAVGEPGINQETWAYWWKNYRLIYKGLQG